MAPDPNVLNLSTDVFPLSPPLGDIAEALPRTIWWSHVSQTQWKGDISLAGSFCVVDRGWARHPVVLYPLQAVTDEFTLRVSARSWLGSKIVSSNEFLQGPWKTSFERQCKHQVNKKQPWFLVGILFCFAVAECFWQLLTWSQSSWQVGQFQK